MRNYFGSVHLIIKNCSVSFCYFIVEHLKLNKVQLALFIQNVEFQKPNLSNYMIVSTFIYLFFIILSSSDHQNSTEIKDLYNTGEISKGVVLIDGETDPHYKLIKSSDNGYPGPDCKVSLSNGFPMDRWVPNSNRSKWIAPRTDAFKFNEPGIYVYRTEFDLSEFESENIVISGEWSTDNNGVDILINGNSTGFATPIEAYYGMFPFEIKNGFVKGINTLDFLVYNISAPTGLRVELQGRGVKKIITSR